MSSSWRFQHEPDGGAENLETGNETRYSNSIMYTFAVRTFAHRTRGSTGRREANIVLVALRLEPNFANSQSDLLCDMECSSPEMPRGIIYAQIGCALSEQSRREDNLLAVAREKISRVPSSIVLLASSFSKTRYSHLQVLWKMSGEADSLFFMHHLHLPPEAQRDSSRAVLYLPCQVRDVLEPGPSQAFASVTTFFASKHLQASSLSAYFYVRTHLLGIKVRRRLKALLIGHSSTHAPIWTSSRTRRCLGGWNSQKKIRHVIKAPAKDLMSALRAPQPSSFPPCTSELRTRRAENSRLTAKPL